MAGLDFTETRFTPAFRELIRDPAVVEEFDRLAAFLRVALAGTAQPVMEVNLEAGPPLFFNNDNGEEALLTTQPPSAIQASDGVTPIPNAVSHHYRYTTQILNRYYTLLRGGAGGSGGGVVSGGGGISYAQRDVGHAQIQSLNSSPVEILAAPGAGKVLAVIRAAVSIDFPTSAYSGNPQGSLQYASGVDAALFTLRLGTTGQRWYSIAGATQDITTITQVDDVALNFTAATDVTGGLAGNKIRVMVLYRTETLL